MGAPNQQRRPVALSDRGLGRAPVPETDIALDAKSLDRGGDTLLKGAGDVFSGLADKIGTLADQAAKREGTEEGQRAGLDPEFRPSRLGTIRAEAYDAAALEVQKGQLVGRFGEDLAEAHRQHRGSPAALDTALQERRRGWIDRSDPALHADIERIYAHNRLTFMRDAARLQDANAIESLRASTQDELSTRLRGMGQRAFLLGLDPAADQVLETELEELRGRLSIRGPHGERVFDEQRQTTLMYAARDAVARGRVLGAFSRLPDVPAREEFLRQLSDDFGNSRGVAATFDLPGFERLQNALEADLRQARSALNIGNRELAREVRDVQNTARQGILPGDDELAELRGRVLGSGNPLLADALDNAVQMAEFHRNAVRTPLGGLEQFTVAERARLGAGGTRAEKDRLMMIEGILGNMRTGLASDPVAFAERTGLVRPTELDVSSGEALTRTLRARLPVADEVASHHGVPRRYLKDSDKRALIAAASEGGDRMIAVVAGIQAAAGERAPDVLREIFDHNAPVLATVGALANAGAPRATINDAAYGIQMRRAADYRPATPAQGDTSALVAEVYGTAFGPMEVSRRASVDLANLLYEVRARRAGVSAFDGTLYRQALRDAIGESAREGQRYGGMINQGWWTRAPIVIPPDVRQDKWRELLDAVRAEDVILEGAPNNNLPIGDRGQIPLARVRNGTLVPAGGGFRYWVAEGDATSPGNERYLMVRPGGGQAGRFVLDMQAIAPTLRRRRPDLFYGASAAGVRPPGMMRLGGPIDDDDAPEEFVDTREPGAGVAPELLLQLRQMPDDLVAEFGYRRVNRHPGPR